MKLPTRTSPQVISFASSLPLGGESIGRVVHTDGGAFIEPPKYKFHNAYFSVVDEKTKELIHFEKDIGDLYSGLAEYKAIEWAIENIKERPLTIKSDCRVAISWAKKGRSRMSSQFRVLPLNLERVNLCWQHENLADDWNAQNHSPKKSKKFYIDRFYEKNNRRFAKNIVRT